MSILTTYAREGNAFALKDPRFYGPNGHRGQDYYAAEGSPITSYESGVIRKIQFSTYLGWCIVLESDIDGAFHGWAHTYAPKVKVGQWVPANMTLGLVAGRNNQPGSTWDGAHIHTTRGPSVESIFNGTVWDPRPHINAAKGATPATSTTNPVPVAIPQRRSNKMYLAWTTDGTGWLCTQQGWTGLPSMQVYSLFSRMINSDQGKGKPDTFNRAEVDIMAGQQRIIAFAANNNVQIDPIKLASAISDALPGKLKIEATMPATMMEKLDKIDKGISGIELTPEDFNIKANVDPVLLAAAFDSAIPRVSAAILRAQGAALAQIK